MAETLASFLETSRDALRRPGNVGSIGSQVPQSRITLRGGEHFLRIGPPVGRHAQYPIGMQAPGDQLEEGSLYEAALVMAFFRPRIGEKDHHLVEAVRRNLLSQHFNGIVADHTHVGEPLRFERQQHATDAGTVHFDPKIVALRVSGGHFHQIVTVAEANLDGARRMTPEERVEIRRGRCVWLYAVLWPQQFQSAFLRLGDTPRAGDEGADSARMFWMSHELRQLKGERILRDERVTLK